MKYHKTYIDGLFLITPELFKDERGLFFEGWKQDSFNKNVTETKFIQDNISISKRGVLRGLHYQIEKPQGKLIKVNQGCIFDVAVDIRKNSETCGKWYGVELSSENMKQLWVPKGFAHGFYVISDMAEVMYKVDEKYYPNYEHCISWNDEYLDIKWPIYDEPILSTKDKLGISFKDANKLA